jgi:hypothetical protein
MVKQGMKTAKGDKVSLAGNGNVGVTLLSLCAVPTTSLECQTARSKVDGRESCFVGAISY